ncbi:MAG: pilus assembly protein [Pseudomonadota bacterium]
MPADLRSAPRRAIKGTSMVEVLVTLVIIAFGLLGISGMHLRLQTVELESYQRSQALLLLNDMANRVMTNRAAAASYVTGSGNPLGAGMTCPTTTSTVVQRDLTEWCNALQGASETSTVGGVTSRVGVMVGGRGCVETVGSDYLITVAWQGMGAVSAPPTSVACGQGSYNTTGTSCVNDACRRVVTTIVRMATL